MFRPNPPEFGRLLTMAVKLLAAQRDGSMAQAQADLARAIDRPSGHCLMYWRKGHLPAPEDIQKLGQAILEQAAEAGIETLDQKWLNAYSRAAGYPTVEAIVEIL